LTPDRRRQPAEQLSKLGAGDQAIRVLVLVELPPATQPTGCTTTHPFRASVVRSDVHANGIDESFHVFGCAPRAFAMNNQEYFLADVAHVGRLDSKPDEPARDDGLVDRVKRFEVEGFSVGIRAVVVHV